MSYFIDPHKFYEANLIFFAPLLKKQTQAVAVSDLTCMATGKKSSSQGWETVRQLRVLDVFAESEFSLQHPLWAAHSHLQLQLQGSNTLFWSPGHAGMQARTHTLTQINKFLKKCFEVSKTSFSWFKQQGCFLSHRRVWEEKERAVKKHWEFSLWRLRGRCSLFTSSWRSAYFLFCCVLSYFSAGGSKLCTCQTHDLS